MCACVYVSYSHGRLYMYPRLAPVIAVSVSGRSLLRQTPVRVEAFDLEQSFSDQTIGVPIGEWKRFFFLLYTNGALHFNGRVVFGDSETLWELWLAGQTESQTRAESFTFVYRSNRTLKGCELLSWTYWAEQTYYLWQRSTTFDIVHIIELSLADYVQVWKKLLWGILRKQGNKQTNIYICALAFRKINCIF